MAKIIKAENKKKEREIEKAKASIKEASDDAMEKLAKVMTNEPTLVKLADIGWEVTALKPAVQWEIAKLACGVHKVEKASFGDILTSLSGNLPDMAKIVTFALLNDKERIKNEFDEVYDTLMWESNPSEWATLLFEILNLMDVNFFFAITQTIETFRTMTLTRKKTMEEQKLL
jgi:hypothetical protein